MNEQPKPLVSIIMPSYNSDIFLVKAIESVLEQTVQNWELLICDDCSSDSSLLKAAEYEKKDCRIRVIKNKTNTGTASSRNALLSMAAGRYITFLDSDDTLLPNYLESQLTFIKKKNAAVITAGYYRKTSSSNTPFLPPALISYKQCCRGNPMSCLTTLYDRELVGNPLFDPSYKKSEDWVFWLNMLKNGTVCYGNNETLAIYNIHEGSKNRNKKSLIKYNYKVFRESQNMNPLLSIIHVAQWALYGLKKYRKVK